ncbi:MAG: acyl carrier protein [Lamprobacter sp.]|uniref:acyl carrier protein n=1 Tax=Lamprobacter sp. TaxID=3100796 RepID=UPI002B25D691|nr:acyl carrier protein [Lamprobacter sp.]MEA3642769.1 acyl carrier protein [Lamprobacter sp.]
MPDLDPILLRTFKLSDPVQLDGLRLGDIPTWDSLSHMELILAIESAYDLRLTGDEIADLTSVAAIRALLANKVGAETN